MAAGKSQRGYGITPEDMEASRLVFVSVKGAKPRRKVAVPVPEAYSWRDFCAQVQSKLKLSGVESIHLALTGESINSVDDLQDIDELHVVEQSKPPPPVIAASHVESLRSLNNGVEPYRLSSAGASLTTSYSQGQASGQGGAALSVEVPGDQGAAVQAKIHRHQSMQRHQALSPGSGLTPAPEPGGEAPGDSSKYVRRTGRLQRLLQRLLPASMFPGNLPVTTRDLPQTEARKTLGPGRRRRRQQSFLNLRSMIVLFALLLILGTMLLLYNRVSPRLPGM